jgi:hypothetical protein
LNFLLLAKGESVATARILAISADQRFIAKFLHELANEAEDAAEGAEETESEQRSALRLVRSADGE